MKNTKKTNTEIVLQKLKEIPDKDRFLQMKDKSIKISEAINAVETMSITGRELVSIYSQNKKINQIL